MAEQIAMLDSQESEDQDIDIVSSVLGPEGLFAYLRRNLAINNNLAGDLFGWKPQLLADPPYHEICASNTRGDHPHAFDLWHKFALDSYTGTSLTELCKCLRSAGSAKKKLIAVAKKIESAMKAYNCKASQSTPSMISGGNLPGQSNSGSSSVSSRDRPSRSDVSGIKRSRKRSPHHQYGSSGQKRKQSSEDSEESDSTNASKLFQYKSKKNKSTSSRKYSLRRRAYSDVSVKDVIRCIKHETLHAGIMKLLDEHRTGLLFRDWELINEGCRDDILGDLKANNKTKAADRLIDYFDNSHTGEELLLFCKFLRKEAKGAGRNPQMLKLAETIEDAVYDVSAGPSGTSK